MQTEKTERRAAYNVRFGVMAAAAPQKRQCEFGSLYPAATAVEAVAAPSQAAGTLHEMGKIQCVRQRMDEIQ